ncbi:MAG: pro-sigmaK processing inhibitor BofA [Clostridia bacterium]|nr:pro-sigmaK processing inhibitor BofA [Clostridia bacterium]
MELINILTYISGLCIIFVLCRIFIVPLKVMLKLLINSIIGALIILFINFIGGLFNFHIGLNFFTIIFVSLLGIPGAILLTIIKFII